MTRLIIKQKYAVSELRCFILDKAYLVIGKQVCVVVTSCTEILQANIQ